MGRDQVRRLVKIILISAAVVLVLAVVAFLAVVLWKVLSIYIDPQTATERKDLVQSFALIVAGGVGSLSALAAVGNLYVSRRNLQQQRELEVQRAQENALPAYLDQMVQLLNDKDSPLRHSKGGDEVSILARVRTITVLPRLDGDRKGSVVQFLYEAGLIAKSQLVLDLREADLSKAYLRIANLSEANLRHTNLSEADLRAADLRGADLSIANLSKAALYRANLRGTDLRGTDLKGANLSEADLSEAALIKANLSGANLTFANLNDSDLTDALLDGAEGITNEELEQQTETLEGATMPNGQKYEDWLEEQEGPGEDVENSGSS